jgi:SNF2 family DNA or RNA helicase
VSNLLIADDVGLGKTIEAGLILRELFLRRRIDFTAVAAPPSMTLQWQDELEAKFGLAFTIIDRERRSRRHPDAVSLLTLCLPLKQSCLVRSL